MDKNTRLGLIALTAAAIIYLFFKGPPQTTPPAKKSQGNQANPIVSVKLPASLTSTAQTGKTLFNENCASCHGQHAGGQKGVAPPLVHKIYEPSHHADEGFQRAVAFGVRAHHWPFGNMAPVKSLNRDQVSKIIAYVRELQRANGIF